MQIFSKENFTSGKVAKKIIFNVKKLYIFFGGDVKFV